LTLTNPAKLLCMFDWLVWLYPLFSRDRSVEALYRYQRIWTLDRPIRERNGHLDTHLKTVQRDKLPTAHFYWGLVWCIWLKL